MITTNEHRPTDTNTNWGARLKAAREAIALTEKDAANRLHLKSHIITTIENEAFENGPPTVFMRGYLRSYARLLNFNEQDIEQALNQLTRTMPPTPTLTASPRIDEPMYTNTSYVRWVTAIIILMLIGLVGAWWNSRASYTTPLEVAPQPIPKIAVTTPAVNTSDTITAATTASAPITIAPVATPNNTAPAPLSITPPIAASDATDSAPETTTPQSKKSPGVSHLKMVQPEDGLEPEAEPGSEEDN